MSHKDARDTALYWANKKEGCVGADFIAEHYGTTKNAVYVARENIKSLHDTEG